MKTVPRSLYAAVALIVTAAPLTGCSTLLYAPSRAKYYDPAAIKLAYEEVKFPSLEDGRSLGAWYFPARAGVKPRGIIAFFHGNGENLSSHFITLSWLPQYGYEFFIFDYQGYGPSEGEPSPEGTVKDGTAALRWVQAKAKEKGLPVIVFGQSLGGVVAMRTVLENKASISIDWLVIDSTFQSYQTAAASLLRTKWFTWPLQPLAYLTISDRWSMENRVGELAPIPMLVIHGTEDNLVSFDQGKKVFADAGPPKEFWEIPGGNHIDVFSVHEGRYRKKFLDALNTRFPVR